LGRDYFKSEIIWHYRRWSNSRKALLPAHQTIYYYTKSAEYTFNTIWQDYSLSTNVDQILQRRVRDKHGKAVYQRDESGEVVSAGGKKGVPLGDVWDIPYLNPKATERKGYPTQKPLALLERIIHIASNEGDQVLDPFCGSGTTLVAAKMLDRRSIGIDISEDAVELAQVRLLELQKSESHLLAKGREAYRNSDEASLALLIGLDYTPVQRNKGIDAILKEDFEGTSIPVRVQKEGETLLEAARKLYRAAQHKNVRVMFLVAKAKGAYLELGDEIPSGMIVVDSPALGIQERLSILKADGFG